MVLTFYCLMGCSEETNNKQIEKYMVIMMLSILKEKIERIENSMRRFVICKIVIYVIQMCVYINEIHYFS